MPAGSLSDPVYGVPMTMYLLLTERPDLVGAEDPEVRFYSRYHWLRRFLDARAAVLGDTEDQDPIVVRLLEDAAVPVDWALIEEMDQAFGRDRVVSTTELGRVSDVDRTRAFYEQVLGWKCRDARHRSCRALQATYGSVNWLVIEDPAATSLDSGGSAVCVRVPDLAAAAKRAQALGGKINRADTNHALIADPDGHLFSVTTE